MELDKILKLIGAGYSKEDIEKFEEAANPDTEAAEAPAAEAKQETQTTAPAAQNDEILSAINKLTQAIITKNLNGTTAETTAEQTTTDILAKVIAPPKKGK